MTGLTKLSMNLTHEKRLKNTLDMISPIFLRSYKNNFTLAFHLPMYRRETIQLYWGCAGRAGHAAGVLRSEILTPDLKFLLAQMALCWPRVNVGYQRSPHQSTTPRRDTA